MPVLAPRVQGKFMLWFVGIVLIACWFGAMFDKNHNGLRIDVDENTLLIGFSMLLAGWLIALNLPSKKAADRLASNYVVFATTLGSTAMTRDQLAEQAGESTSYTLETPGAYETKVTQLAANAIS